MRVEVAVTVSVCVYVCGSGHQDTGRGASSDPMSDICDRENAGCWTSGIFRVTLR